MNMYAPPSLSLPLSLSLSLSLPRSPSPTLSHSRPQCTACSECVVKAYAEGGMEFLMKCFDEPGYIEQVTGLDLMQAGIEDIDFDLDEDFSE